MSYHGKLQTLKNGTADAEIQLWAYQQLEKEPAKTLTDEEINQLWAESHEDGIAIQQGFTTQQHYFARAILRKAQDK